MNGSSSNVFSDRVFYCVGVLHFRGLVDVRLPFSVYILCFSYYVWAGVTAFSADNDY